MATKRQTAGGKEAELRTRTKLLHGKNADKVAAKDKVAAEADGETTAIGLHKRGEVLDQNQGPIAHGHDHVQGQSHQQAVNHHRDQAIVSISHVHLAVIAQYGW